MQGIRFMPLALALGALLAPAHAQQAGDATLKDVVVTATRTEADAAQVPATVTAITRKAVTPCRHK